MAKPTEKATALTKEPDFEPLSVSEVA